MMRRVLLLSMPLLLAAAPPPIVPTAATPLQQRRIDALFARWNRPTTPGCALEAREGEQPLIIRAYGSEDLEHITPIRPTTLFEAGSISKQFTAAAILLLAEDGRLKLDDDVRRYVPELPRYETPIRIQHLLNHTNGLRDWGAIAELAGWPRGTAAYDMDDVLAIVARQKQLNFAPGSEYSYGNSGYALLALIVARVSGTSLPRFTTQRLFQPLGMTSTGWRDDFRRIVPNRAIAYSPRGPLYQQDMPFESDYGYAGLLTTVGDLGRWAQAMMAGRIGRSVAADLQKRGVLNDGSTIRYARGLFVTRFAGLVELSHAGSTAGYRGWLAAYPSRRLSVALLCNTADADSAGLGGAVAATLLGPTPSPPIRADVGQPATAGDWAGLYLDAHDQPLTIVSDNGRYRLAGGGALFPLATDRFRMGDDSELKLATPGEIDLSSPYGHGRYRRIVPATRIELADFAGRYSSEEVGATYRVFVDGGELRLRLENRPQIELRAKPVGADLFEARGAMVRFRRSTAGRVAALAISIPRAFDVRFDRIE